MKSFRRLSLLAVLVSAPWLAQGAPLELDTARSRIEVAVAATMDSFVGHLEKYDARIGWDAAASQPGTAELRFDFKNLKTGNQSRDEAMLKWLEYETYPKAEFHLRSWKQAGAFARAVGDLTMHGVTREIEMPVALARANGTAEISGEVTINHLDFKLPKIRKLALLTVKPELKIKFQLHLNQRAEAR